MAKLSAIQNAFQNYLMSAEEKDILPSIVDDDIPAPKRLKIYFDAYRLRLLDILQQDFPKTLILMGEETFEKAFHEYLKQYPSHHFSVRFFGQHFSAFLQETVEFKSLPVLSEMAHFEWSLMDTLDAKNAPIANLQQLSNLPADKWPQVRLAFHPSLRVINCDWDTPSLWKVIDNEEPPRQPVKNNQPLTWLIWRSELRSLFHSLTEHQKILFDSFKQGENLAGTLECLSEHMDEEAVPTFAVQNMQLWIDKGMVSELKI